MGKARGEDGLACGCVVEFACACARGEEGRKLLEFDLAFEVEVELE